MEWCRLTVLDDGASRPDMALVDQIARLALVAHRAGGRLVVDRMSHDLAALFELAGLAVEVQRQSERREQPLRLERRQEYGQLGDPAS